MHQGNAIGLSAIVHKINAVGTEIEFVWWFWTSDIQPAVSRQFVYQPQQNVTICPSARLLSPCERGRNRLETSAWFECIHTCHVYLYADCLTHREVNNFLIEREVNKDGNNHRPLYMCKYDVLQCVAVCCRRGVGNSRQMDWRRERLTKLVRVIAHCAALDWHALILLHPHHVSA